MIDLSNIEDECGPVQGGLNRLWVIPAREVVSIPDPEQLVITDSVVLQNGASFFVVEFSENSGSYKEPMAETDNGEYYKAALQILVPKDRPQVGYFCDQLQGVRCILIYQDANGYRKLIGSPDWPLTFKSELDTGSGGSAKNGRTLTWSGELPEPAPFFEGTFTVSDPELPTGVFDETYDFTFN